MSKKKYFSIGKILGTRGISGELKVDSWTDTPNDFYLIKKMFFDINDKPLEIIYKKIYKSKILIKIKNINDTSSAKNLQGKTLYAFREDIPLDKERYFIEDLKNLSIVNNKTNKIHGVLIDVINNGASDIYIIKDDNNKQYMLPIIKGTIEKISLDENKIYINPIDGVFDDN